MSWVTLKPYQRWRVQTLPDSEGVTWDFTLVKPTASGNWHITGHSRPDLVWKDVAYADWWPGGDGYVMILLCAKMHEGS